MEGNAGTKFRSMPFNYLSATRDIEHVIGVIRQRVTNALDAPESEVSMLDKLKLQNLHQLFAALESYPDKRALLGLNELVLELVATAHEETVANMLKAGAEAANNHPLE